MSVPVNQRTTGKLEVIVKARELAEYTITIVTNPKHFDVAYKEAIGDKLIDTALGIYTLCFSANAIMLDTERDERRAKQEEAISFCNEFEALIELAKGLYHLSTKRCVYWVSQVQTVKKLIRSWRDSDAKRLKA